MWIKKLIFGLFVLAIVGCENRAANAEDLMTLVVNHDPTEEFPYGYADVQMGKALMRIPKDIGQVGTGGNVTIHKLWPEFVKPTDEARPNTLQRALDTINIFFSPPRRGSDELGVQGEAIQAKARAEKIIYELEKSRTRSEEYPDYWLGSYPSGSAANYYVPDQDDAVGIAGQKMFFYCEHHPRLNTKALVDSDLNDIAHDKHSIAMQLANSPRCEAGGTASNGYRLRVRFYKKHLRDGVAIYQKALELRDSLIVSNQ